jgi:hypothetical protein
MQVARACRSGCASQVDFAECTLNGGKRTGSSSMAVGHHHPQPTQRGGEWDTVGSVPDGTADGCRDCGDPSSSDDGATASRASSDSSHRGQPVEQLPTHDGLDGVLHEYEHAA